MFELVMCYVPKWSILFLKSFWVFMYAQQEISAHAKELQQNVLTYIKKIFVIKLIF